MSCDTCNSVFKREVWGNKSKQSVMHPMLNNIFNDVYILADVNYLAQAIQVSYKVQAGLPLSSLLERHFSLMKLNDRYCARSAFIEVPKMVKILASESTTLRKTDRLENFVQDQMVANEPNSMEHAFYSKILAMVPIIAKGGL
ncbi:MAG: hypothetical protein CFE43_21140 [Burkholderiales bacterium PBB3]|nr:MAG: hypothetical protein CFE43_21140 [Burkholderiales bacterium PBB3]